MAPSNVDRAGTITRSVGTASALVAVGMSLAIIAYAYGGLDLPQRQFANLVLGASVGLYYLIETRSLLNEGGLSSWERGKAAAFGLLAVTGLSAATYVHVSYWRWLERGRLGLYTDLDLLVGALLIFAVVDITYREYGRLLSGVIVLTILYGYFGALLPGLLAHPGMSPEDMIFRLTINLSGVYSFLLQLGATWIAIFIIFAGLLQGYKGFDYILELGSHVADRTRSGVAQTAVISSMIMGSMLGSSAANVATTGSFTIPLMKDQGIPPRIAAAIESTASTGGQILPPIMGAAAFIMADIIGVQYAKVAIGGIIPALLFYLTVTIGVHYLILKNGWHTSDSATNRDRRSRRALLVHGVQYVVPLVVLVYLLMINQWGPLKSGLYTIAVLLVTRGVGGGLLRSDPVEFLTETVSGLRLGAENLAPFIALTGSLGIAISIITQTGLSQKIAINMVIIADGVFITTLIIAMFVGLLFGLGMPTPAAYVLVATIVAPALVELGVAKLSAHLFLFYFALLSAITPPIAVAVAVAVGIAGADFFSACLETIKLSGGVFLIPFMIIEHPSIVYWEFPETVFSVVLLSVACWAMVNALTGFNGSRRLSLAVRGAVGALALVVVFGPTPSVKIIGLLAFLVLHRLTLQDELPEFVPALDRGS